jgi:hypothetical protein
MMADGKEELVGFTAHPIKGTDAYWVVSEDKYYIFCFEVG